MQGKMVRSVKKRASTPQYVSPNQLILEGFETPFEQKLTLDNRWVTMSKLIPWDEIVSFYNHQFSSTEGRPPINGRIILGALMIKHIEALSDRATIQHIRENMFMQYFLGYSSFTNEEPFSDTLFVEIRKRLSLDLLSKINEIIVLHCILDPEDNIDNDRMPPPPSNNESGTLRSEKVEPEQCTILQSSAPKDLIIEEAKPIENKGRLITDATVAPQNITYPTDLKLLNASRQKSEELIDKLYDPTRHGPVKPRTYRQVARKFFLNTAKKKGKTKKEIYKANGRQLRYLRRNLGHIDVLLEAYDSFPLKYRDLKYLMVLRTVYQQQEQLHRTRSTRIEHRIVNIHQPHVRPIVRGKDRAKVEFGSKIQVSLVEGFTFIDHLSWDAFNESQYLQTSISNYQRRFGFYPKEILADQIYCTRQNRKMCKDWGIKLVAKPLGRPSLTAVAVHLSPGERNPIEGKFGQAKIAYGLDNIKAKLKETSESWIATIALVLNLVRMARQALLSLINKLLNLNLFKITNWEADKRLIPLLSC